MNDYRGFSFPKYNLTPEQCHPDGKLTYIVELDQPPGLYRALCPGCGIPIWIMVHPPAKSETTK